ncbi:MAG: thiamine pyrophosphate-binding protein [Eggerthella lenta]|nr:thiamine pyrophosphate-binding protein [Eggerthella lenta]
MATYSDERAAQILTALLKEHGIRKVIVSPGSTNIEFVFNVQNDPYFEVYSSADERSAAYIACGMAASSGEPVVLSCTGATASRNYYPGLTEAYYRKLPVLAVTSSQLVGRVGRMIPQVTDRSRQPADVVRKSVHIPVVESEEDEWSSNLLINEAIIALRQGGGGPVHIDLTSEYYKSLYDVKSIKPVRPVRLHDDVRGLPSIPKGRTAVFVGAHLPWTERLTNAVEAFCDRHDAVVLCDQTSNYSGAHAVYPQLVCEQSMYDFPLRHMDLLIHIGEISGSYLSVSPKSVWRVSRDGRLADPFHALEAVFEMEEASFFEAHAGAEAVAEGSQPTYLQQWRDEVARIEGKVPDLPFSNIWVARESAGMVPEGSVVHFGILNSLRAWNLAPTPANCKGFCNTGGFGIDGCVSSLIGSSLALPDALHFGIVGDLAFFYDLNSLGNRHIGSNLRVMLVNNGCGTEFKMYSHTAFQFGEEADGFMAAAGHYGARSRDLVKGYATALGFEYLSAAGKDDFARASRRFFDPEPAERPMVLEIFTDPVDESSALQKMRSLGSPAKGAIKNVAKGILGESGTRKLKSLFGK